MHKKSLTYIRDLRSEAYFGEIGFFSKKQRSVSVKSRDFTEVLALDSQFLEEIAMDFPKARKTFQRIKEEISNCKYKMLKVTCYICDNPGHISVHCT